MYTPKGKKIKISTAEGSTEELISTKTGLPYRGDYVYNAAEQTYSDPSGNIELTLIAQESSISENEVNVLPTKYDQVIKQESVYNLRNTRSIEQYIPSPTQQDYDRQGITRYFAQHKQTGVITEISSATYKAISSKSTIYHHPSYLIGKTAWLLRGPVANQDINGYIVRGTAEKNEELISILEATLPNIRTYLTDPTQFVE